MQAHLKKAASLFLILLLFQNCNNAQQNIAGTNSNNPAELASNSEQPSTDDRTFQLTKQIKLPKELADATNIAVDLGTAYLLVDGKVYVYDLKKEKTTNSFDLVDSKGNKLSITRYGKHDLYYQEEKDYLFLVLEHSICYYASTGAFLGELKKPTNNFEPRDIAFDFYNNGIYALDINIKPSCVYFWEDVQAEPVTIFKGNYDIDPVNITSIHSFSNPVIKILDYTSTLHHFHQDIETNAWKFTEVLAYDKQNNFDPEGNQMESNGNEIFILEHLSKEASTPIIKIYSCLKKDASENVFLQTIDNLPKHPTLGITVIQDFALDGIEELLILSQGIILEYKNGYGEKK